MVDTVKIYTEINKNLYDTIYNMSIIKVAYSNKTQVKYYEIVNDKLEGSYSSSLSVRIGCGSKYKFVDGMYFLEIEGSYHKICRGYNSHNGFYDLEDICRNLIALVENAYKIELPEFKKWYLQRVDIALCFDLKEQNNVCTYINNINSCRYPKRNMKFYANESLYCSGTSTTLKVYNKKKEFLKHDLKKFKSTDFDLIKYLDTIEGYIRFECEIKKKKLKQIYDNKFYNIPILFFDYNKLMEVWSDEFMKLLKLGEQDLNIITDRADVYQALINNYTQAKATVLYNFYLIVTCEGLQSAKNKYTKPTYYRNLKALKELNIDLTQKVDLDLVDNRIDFNPFNYEEVI